MGRISINNAGQYASSSDQPNWFFLDDDGHSALVTFLYEEEDGSDLDYFLCHEVEVDGRRIKVNCTATDDEGFDVPENCPLCQEGYPRVEKLYLQLYNHDAREIQVWDRGRAMVPTIEKFISEFGALVTQPFEVFRNGRRGDQRTTYDLIATEPKLDARIEDYGEKVEILGDSIVYDLTEDEMYDVIDNRYHLKSNKQAENSRGGARSARGNRGSRRQATNSRQASSRNSRSLDSTEPRRRNARGSSEQSEERFSRPGRERASQSERSDARRGRARAVSNEEDGPINRARQRRQSR